MPLYDYLCEACGRTSEVLQRFADPPLESCPHCGGKVKKQPSAPAFHLKGSGWYATDFKGGGAKPAAKAEGGSDSKDSGKGAAPACGTGACAAVTASALEGRSPFDTWVPVQLPGGLLEIKVKADRSQVWLKGPAKFVFEGRVP